MLSALAAAHFIAGAEALHVLLATLTPAASVVGAGSWSSAACYAAAWIMQSRACGGFARAAIVKGGASFVVVTALLAAKHNMFHGGVVKGAAAAAASAATSAATSAASATTGAHPALDIALALVGVWALMSGVALDTAAAGTVEEAFDATKFGRALAPAKERAVKFARRLPIAAAFAAAFASIAMNPNAVAALASIGVEPRAILPLFIALAAPAATAVARAAAPAFSDANVAMFAAFAMFVNAGLAARDRPAVAAGALGGLFAAATAVVAPAMSVALTDYFVVRKRNLDTHALVDGDDSRGDFWFTGGFNPRAVAAAVAGAAVPLWDFAATAAIGARMVGVTGAGVECIVAPGVALARGAGAGALVSSALYLLFNKLAAPAPRVASGGGAYARGGTTAARVIAADGTATYVDDIVDAERGAATDAEIVGGAMGSGAEAKGQTWSRPGGGGGPRGDGPEEDDDGVADVDVEKARSRLERFFEMESEEPPPFTDQPEEDADLGVGLGVSLRAELQSQLERRRAKLGDLRAQKSAGKNVPDATVARVEADVEALRREIKAFEDGGFAYSKNASSRLVSRNASEIRRARRSHREGSASGGYLDVAGEWREVSEAAAAVTRLDVELEKMSSRAAVTGKPVDAAEMNELREQRAVWGLRLVSAQIKGIVGIQSAMIEGDADASADALGENIRRLQELTAEKSALLEKLSETERKGAEASGAAEKLRAEVAELKVRLEGYKTLEGKRARWDSDRAELEKKLRDAEAAKFRLKMQSENETSKLYAEAKRLKERLAGRKGRSPRRAPWRPRRRTSRRSRRRLPT